MKFRAERPYPWGDWTVTDGSVSLSIDQYGRCKVISYIGQRSSDFVARDLFDAVRLCRETLIAAGWKTRMRKGSPEKREYCEMLAALLNGEGPK